MVSQSAKMQGAVNLTYVPPFLHDFGQSQTLLSRSKRQVSNQPYFQSSRMMRQGCQVELTSGQWCRERGWRDDLGLAVVSGWRDKGSTI